MILDAYGTPQLVYRRKDDFGTAGDLVHLGYGAQFKSKEEIEQEKKYKKEKLKMNPPRNFNDKRQKKEWEK